MLLFQFLILLILKFLHLKIRFFPKSNKISKYFLKVAEPILGLFSTASNNISFRCSTFLLGENKEFIYTENGLFIHFSLCLCVFVAT